MTKLIPVLTLLMSFTAFSIEANALQNTIEMVTASVTDVSDEYAEATLPEVLPMPSVAPTAALGGIDLKQIVTIGTKVWDFIVSNQPTADYKTLRASVVPAGITSWTQLVWQKDAVITKVFRVAFKNPFGGSAGGFDYRVTYVYGGTFKGKGKFLGQIAVTPLNVKLNTDRSLEFKAELLEPMNFGSEEDPIAGAQLSVTWSSPITTRYTMSSAEYMIYGDGDIKTLGK